MKPTRLLVLLTLIIPTLHVTAQDTIDISALPGKKPFDIQELSSYSHIIYYTKYRFIEDKDAKLKSVKTKVKRYKRRYFEEEYHFNEQGWLVKRVIRQKMYYSNTPIINPRWSYKKKERRIRKTRKRSKEDYYIKAYETYYQYKEEEDHYKVYTTEDRDSSYTLFMSYDKQTGYIKPKIDTNSLHQYLFNYDNSGRLIEELHISPNYRNPQWLDTAVDEYTYKTAGDTVLVTKKSISKGNHHYSSRYQVFYYSKNGKKLYYHCECEPLPRHTKEKEPLDEEYKKPPTEDELRCGKNGFVIYNNGTSMHNYTESKGGKRKIMYEYY